MKFLNKDPVHRCKVPDKYKCDAFDEPVTYDGATATYNGTSLLQGRHRVLRFFQKCAQEEALIDVSGNDNSENSSRCICYCRCT